MEDQYRMIATDGHRLVKIVNTNFNNPGFIREIIIPTKALNFVARNLPEEGAQQIVLSENHVLFELPNTKIYSRLIKDPYPDYERVIPTENDKDLVINKNDFISSVKRVSLFSNPMTNQIRLSMSEGTLTVSAQDIDFGGEAKESIKCKYDLESLNMAYNATYLLDILRHLDTDEIVLKIKDSDDPGLAYPSEQNKDEEILMLIMPVRLNN
jgi:DNA polymerase-3 subunit beta